MNLKREPLRETDELLAYAAAYMEQKAELDKAEGEYTGYSGSYYFQKDRDRLERAALDFEDTLFALFNKWREEKGG